MTRVILTDIEGTTTDIAFVHAVLFPYSKAQLPDFLRTHSEDAAVRHCIEQVKATVLEEDGQTLSDAEVTDTLLQWIASDRKHTALKNLQGFIWKVGFEQQAYCGHLYPDVPPVLQAWKAAGLTLAVYSSGSVQAQQLLFSHSVAGDLRPLFSHYFDTTIGHKRDPDSYARIAETLKTPALEILFLSDIPEELDAAAQAGMQVIQLVRDSFTRLSDYTQVTRFDAIILEQTSAVC